MTEERKSAVSSQLMDCVGEGKSARKTLTLVLVKPPVPSPFSNPKPPAQLQQSLLLLTGLLTLRNTEGLRVVQADKDGSRLDRLQRLEVVW